jgi:hypothetical protein
MGEMLLGFVSVAFEEIIFRTGDDFASAIQASADMCFRGFKFFRHSD